MEKLYFSRGNIKANNFRTVKPYLKLKNNKLNSTNFKDHSICQNPAWRPKYISSTDLLSTYLLIKL